MPLRQAEVPYREGFEYGIGVDAVSGDARALAVEGAVTGIDNARGARFKFSIDRIRHSSDLERCLDIHAEASYGVGAFSVSGRFDFVKECAINESSVFMVVNMRIWLPYMQIDSPVLCASGVEASKDPALFSSRYGDLFVRGITRGGLLVASIGIEASDSTESEKISAELKGAFAGFSAKASTKFAETIKKHAESVSIKVYCEGGPLDVVQVFNQGISDPALMVDLMVKWAAGFDSEPEANAVPYKVNLTPMVVAQAPMPPDPISIQNAQDVLVDCAERRSELLDNINLLQRIVNRPDQFDTTDAASIEACRQAVSDFEADLDTVVDCARFAIDHVTEAAMVTVYATENKVNGFPRGKVPSPLPRPKASTLVQVPDLSKCASWGDVVAACGDDLVPKEITATGAKEVTGFSVVSQSLAFPGTAPPGSEILVSLAPVKVDPPSPVEEMKIERMEPGMGLKIIAANKDG